MTKLCTYMNSFRITSSNVWNSEHCKRHFASTDYVKDPLPWSNHCCRLHERSSHEPSWSMLFKF